MQESINEFIKIPVITSVKERVMVQVLSLFLSYSSFIIAGITLFLYNWYFALSILLFSYLLLGIIASKLSHEYIPYTQQEFSYSDKEIATWIIYRYFGTSMVSEDLTIK